MLDIFDTFFNDNTDNTGEVTVVKEGVGGSSEEIRQLRLGESFLKFSYHKNIEPVATNNSRNWSRLPPQQTQFFVIATFTRLSASRIQI